MKDRKCRICRSDGREFDAFGYRWLKCGACESVQKILTEAEYLGLNPTYDPGHFLDTKSRTELEDYLEIDEKTRFIRPILAREFIGRYNLRFLDVGCGMGGYMLAASRLGCEVLGYEPSADHARIAREVFDLPVVNDYFASDKVGTKFDLVMLSHVIEHLYWPQAFLSDLLQVLKPGGVLVVVTPNASSTLAHICGRYWPMLKAIDHVSLISAKTYNYFQFTELIVMKHYWSGYPFEFASTVLAALRDRIRGVTTATVSGGKASPLKLPSWRSLVLRAALTVASLPVRLLAADRQPCLVTLIRREADLAVR